MQKSITMISTLFFIVLTALLLVPKVLSFNSNLETKRYLQTGKCQITAGCKCTVIQSGPSKGSDCKNIVVTTTTCGMMSVQYYYEYCNWDSNAITLKSDKFKAVMDKTDVSSKMDKSALLPGECRDYTLETQVDTCKFGFYGQIKVEGILNVTSYQYCYAYAFMSNIPLQLPATPTPTKAPIVTDTVPCIVTNDISCTINDSNLPCKENLVEDPKNCYKDVTYTYSYCNKNSMPVKVIKQDVAITIDGQPNLIMNQTTLEPLRCYSQTTSVTVNSCDTFIGSNFKLEGWSQTDTGTNAAYCYSNVFYKIIPKPPPIACDVLAAVDCVRVADEEPCNKTIVNAGTCGDLPVTYYYTYCNLLDDVTVGLDRDKTVAKMNGNSLTVDDTSDMVSDVCRTFERTTSINTCNRSFSGSMKVEGTVKNVANYEYCYDYSFLSYIPLRVPSVTDPIYCDVTAGITCTVDSTGKSCSEIYAPISSCGNVGVTYTYTYCNKISGNDVSLNPKTFIVNQGDVTKVDISQVLQGGSCKTVTKKVTINSCKNFFSSSLKVEGTVKNSSRYTYCYAFKFHKFTPIRAPPTKAPVAKPTAKPVANPTIKPVANLTNKPNAKPTSKPVAKPSSKPTKKPINTVTDESKSPVAKPTGRPTSKPIAMPVKATYKPVASSVKATYKPVASSVKGTYKPVAPKPTNKPKPIAPKPTKKPIAIPDAAPGSSVGKGPTPTAPKPTNKPIAVPDAAPGTTVGKGSVPVAAKQTKSPIPAGYGGKVARR